MPIRIKPVYDLGPCVLDLESIQGICALVDQNFGDSSYSGEDDVWEVYDEDAQGFIAAISAREALDTFMVDASNATETATETNVSNTVSSRPGKAIRLIFDKYQASVKFSGPPDQEHWFEHFLIDLKKCLRGFGSIITVLATAGVSRRRSDVVLTVTISPG